MWQAASKKYPPPESPGVFCQASARTLCHRRDSTARTSPMDPSCTMRLIASNRGIARR